MSPFILQPTLASLMAGPAEFVWVSSPTVFLSCSLDIVCDSHGKLFIGLILNVLLSGINVTQTYLYYIYSKKYVSCSRDTVTTLKNSFFCYVYSEIGCGSKYGWAKWHLDVPFIRTLNSSFYEQVLVVFVTDLIQPLLCSIYLYQTLVADFGMRCYFSEKSHAWRESLFRGHTSIIHGE